MESVENISRVIELEDVSLAYGKHLVLEQVSFEVRQGDCVVVIGGSGCGKSTVLKAMTGLLEPIEGKVKIRGRDYWSADSKERNLITKEFGVLFQGGALWSSMSLLENVSLPLKTHTNLGDDEITEIASYKLSLVGLGGFENFYPSELSGGMKKRAGLARAMSLDPQVLFLDEPSAGLDPLTSRRLDDLINELKESLGITFVVITHELASIFEIADDEVFLDADTKTLVDQGTPEKLLRSSSHEKVRTFLNRGAEPSQNLHIDSCSENS